MSGDERSGERGRELAHGLTHGLARGFARGSGHALAHGQMRSTHARDWLSRADARARFADFCEPFLAEIEQDGSEHAASSEDDTRERAWVACRDESVRELAFGVAASAVPKGTWRTRRFAFPIALVVGFTAVHAAQVVPVAAHGQMHGDVRDEVRERSSVMASNRALALLASVAGVAGLSCVDSALGDAVEWRIADGGNGHWYEKISTVMHWDAHKENAEHLGGHLATITSAAENSVVWNLGDWPVVCWLGGRAPAGQGCDPAAWTWVTGEPWSYAPWAVAEPSECQEALLTFLTEARWNNGYPAPGVAVYEYSADCNSNGIVDYGEIRNGLIEDTNGNNIPDACECAADPSLPTCCPADVIEDSAVNAIDLAAILNTWGTDGGKFPRADVDGSGVVDGADLAAVLSEWGPCGK